MDPGPWAHGPWTLAHGAHGPWTLAHGAQGPWTMGRGPGSMGLGHGFSKIGEQKTDPQIKHKIVEASGLRGWIRLVEAVSNASV